MHVHSPIFQGQLFFKKKVFRSEALVTKKLWGILDFFHADQTFFRPINEKKIFNKKSFKLLFIKCQSISRCQK